MMIKNIEGMLETTTNFFSLDEEQQQAAIEMLNVLAVTEEEAITAELLNEGIDNIDILISTLCTLEKIDETSPTFTATLNRWGNLLGYDVNCVMAEGEQDVSKDAKEKKDGIIKRIRDAISKLITKLKNVAVKLYIGYADDVDTYYKKAVTMFDKVKDLPVTTIERTVEAYHGLASKEVFENITTGNWGAAVVFIETTRNAIVTDHYLKRFNDFVIDGDLEATKEILMEVLATSTWKTVDDVDNITTDFHGIQFSSRFDRKTGMLSAYRMLPNSLSTFELGIKTSPSTKNLVAMSNFIDLLQKLKKQKNADEFAIGIKGIDAGIAKLQTSEELARANVYLKSFVNNSIFFPKMSNAYLRAMFAVFTIFYKMNIKAK